MRTKERETAGKYQRRVARESARKALGEIFDFLQNGIPDGWSAVSDGKVSETQAAFRNILECTYNGKMPEEQSRRVFKECLDLPSIVDFYPQQLRRWKKHLKTGRRKVVLTPILRCGFQCESYFKRIAERLKSYLQECHMVIFVQGVLEDDWPLRSCEKCGRLFLKKKSNQACCSRTCINARYYLKRKETEEGKEYYRRAAKRTYHSGGARLKRRRSGGQACRSFCAAQSAVGC